MRREISLLSVCMLEHAVTSKGMWVNLHKISGRQLIANPLSSPISWQHIGN